MTTVTVHYDDTPPSVNDPKSGHRSHWSRGAAAKKRWEGIFAMLLLAAKTPRPLGRVTATAALRFPDRRRRDEGNFRFMIEKALGDALVKGGWLQDDVAGAYSFQQLTFEDSPGPKRTTVVLELHDLAAAGRQGSTNQEE